MIWREHQDGKITLEMTRDNWGTLLLIFGMALGGISDRNMRNQMLKFINEVNRTNPGFTPYEIPEEPA